MLWLGNLCIVAYVQKVVIKVLWNLRFNLNYCKPHIIMLIDIPPPYSECLTNIDVSFPAAGL